MFSGRRGTMFEGLRKPAELIVIVVTRLSYECPVQAIVHAFGLDERTVADWSAYPNSIRRAFREKVKLTRGVGRACLQIWEDGHIGIVIKRAEKKRVVEITRKMAHGLQEQAEKLLRSSRGGMVLNTAFIE